MRITFISDTHTKHKQLSSLLPGGDLIIHAGDISSMGYKHEIESFCTWLNKLDNYEHKVFISGNHDLMFEQDPEKAREISSSYKWIDYLEDSQMSIQIADGPEVKIYGSPWQPEFYNWAFNLPRNGQELESKWSAIPDDIDILITHGPAHGFLDRITGGWENLGCEKLAEAIKAKKPKIHVCGHIHSGYGYIFDGDTHFINASVLDERYYLTNKPITADWDQETNKLEFI